MINHNLHKQHEYEYDCMTMSTEQYQQDKVIEFFFCQVTFIDLIISLDKFYKPVKNSS